MDGTSKKQKQNHELPAKKCSEVRYLTLSATSLSTQMYQQVVWEALHICWGEGGGGGGGKV